MSKHKPLVGIIMGSDSDLPTMEKAIAICEEFDLNTDCRVGIAHHNVIYLLNLKLINPCLIKILLSP